MGCYGLSVISKAVLASYPPRISSERSNVILDPLKPRQLILQPEIERAPSGRFGTLREPERADSVVYADVHDRSTLPYVGVTGK